MTSQKGIIFSMDAILGIIAIIMIASLLALVASQGNAQPPNKNFQHAQIMIKTHTMLLTGDNTNASTPNSTWKNYFCYTAHSYNSQSGSDISKTHCEETK